MRRIFFRFFFSMLGAMILAFILVIALTLWLLPTPMPPDNELREFIRPLLGRIILVRTVPGLVCMALVCYFLARQMARPLERLRTAIRRFAAGDLNQRATPGLGRRRDEIGQLARDFDAMAERIATLLSNQQRLLRDISHELRSPLARQQIAIELVREQLAESNGSSAIDRVELEAERLNDLIAELLTLARIDNDADGESPATFDLADLLGDVVSDANFEARSRRRAVQLDAPGTCRMLGTPSVLRRAIENVIRNAVRYTAEGTTVDVHLRAGPSAVLTVRDFGPGVPDEALDHIFRPFFRVDDARDRESGGTGIGLAIAHRAIRRHGGTIIARNAPGGGLEVEIAVPRPEEGDAGQKPLAVRVESQGDLR